MALSFFAKWGSDASTVLLIDIGSASIGVAFVALEKGRPPHLSALVRRDIPFQETLTSAQFISAMVRTLDHAIKEAKTRRRETVVPDHIFCTLSAPWFILKNRHLRMSNNEEFEVDAELLRKFFNAEIEKLKEEIKGTLPLKDVVVIEKNIIQTKFNGYEVKDHPYGRKVKDMEIKVTVSLSSLRAIEGIQRAIAHSFHSDSVRFGVFPIAAFSTIRDMFPQGQNFLFLDIAGEATSVSIILHGMLADTVSFPCGKNFFIREVSTNFKTSHEEATTLFNAFLRGELDTPRDAEIARIVEYCRGEWIARLEKAITAFPKSSASFRQIFFTSDEEVKHIFEQSIRVAASKKLGAEKLEVWYLDHMATTDLVTFESGTVRDPFLVIEALFARKLKYG